MNEDEIDKFHEVAGPVYDDIVNSLKKYKDTNPNIVLSLLIHISTQISLGMGIPKDNVIEMLNIIWEGESGEKNERK